MPSPYAKVIAAGLWPRDSLPNPMELKILLHLASSNTARLIVRGDQSWGDKSGVTNNEQGYNFECDGTSLVDLLTTWNGTEHYRPWVREDAAYAKEHSFRFGVKAYRINLKGYDAIAQYYAWERYETKRLDLAEELLIQCRDEARALKPK